MKVCNCWIQGLAYVTGFVIFASRKNKHCIPGTCTHANDYYEPILFSESKCFWVSCAHKGYIYLCQLLVFK